MSASHDAERGGAMGAASRCAGPKGRAAAGGAESSPRLVIRGESSSNILPSTHPYAAITDYLTVTFPFPLGEAGISPFFVGLCSAIGIGLGKLKWPIGAGTSCCRTPICSCGATGRGSS